MPIAEFDQRLSDLDLGLFERIASQTTPEEKRSLLACQLATRELTGGYGYLEIGSYLGGSIQTHLADPLCRRIHSIDKRPRRPADNRGVALKYVDNTTEHMLALLREVDPGQMSKLTCLEADTRELRPEQIEGDVHVCMIDAEHTDAAVVRDFEFCLQVMGDDGLVICHDAHLLYKGLLEIVERLRSRDRPFHAYNLPDGLMVFEIGDFPVHEHAAIAQRLLDNHIGYLSSMMANDYYRQWAEFLPIRMFRVARARLRRAHVSRSG